MKTTCIGIWRMWQHWSCYIGNGFTSLPSGTCRTFNSGLTVVNVTFPPASKVALPRSTKMVKKEKGSQNLLVQTEPITAVLKLHATQRCHKWMARCSGVFLLQHALYYWGSVSGIVSDWSTRRRANTNQIHHAGICLVACNLPGIFIFLAWYHHHDLENLAFKEWVALVALGCTLEM